MLIPPTDQSSENCQHVLTLLAQTTERLVPLAALVTDAQCYQPLAPGEWSLAQILAHLLDCVEVRGQRIYYALILTRPLVPDVHPRRQWEKLLHHGDRPFSELLTEFTLRRHVLISVLEPLTQKKWSREILDEKRPQSVYLLARALALHEHRHCDEIEEALPSFLDNSG